MGSMAAGPTAREIVAELQSAKVRYFDGAAHQPSLDVQTSALVVPEADWQKRHFSPVRLSVATRMDSPLEFRFIATVRFDLTRREPNAIINALVQAPSGVVTDLPVQGAYPKFLRTWEIAMIESGFALKIAVMEAERILGVGEFEGRQCQMFPALSLSRSKY